MKVIGSPPKLDDQHGAETIGAECDATVVSSVCYLTEQVVLNGC